MKWTENQQKVIDSRNKNILVSAAAGSGKTAVLVERIIKLVKDNKEEIDSFLIVTFTNAAAAGMKQKIQKALYKDLEDDSISDDNLKRHLRNQLNKLNKANISTIHSFCIDLLRKNFHVIGIDPNFRIGDPNECQILLNEAVDDVLEQAYTDKSSDFVQLVECFTSNRSDKELVELIKDMYYFILSFPNPLEWFEKSVNMLEITEIELDESIWLSVIRENVGTLLDGAEEAIKLAIDLSKEEAGPIAYFDTFSRDLSNVSELRDSLINSNFNNFINNLYSLSHPRLASIRGKKKEEVDAVLLDDAKSMRNEYKKIVDGIKKLIPNKTMKEFTEAINYMYPAMKALFELVKSLMNEFKIKKADKAILDFGDVEHFALDALSYEDVRESCRNKYKFIFVDEYQDSNQIQETLIGLIKRDNNVFMVGDSKQSIYKFRLADVDLFNSKLRTYKTECDEGDLNQRIDLNHNFRSRFEILAATNYIFEKIMSKKLGELDYNKEVFLNVGTEFKKSKDDRVELDIIETQTVEADEDIDEELQAMKKAEIEAFFAVNKIKDLLGQKTYFAKENEFRTIEFKDIVILLRSVANWSTVFEEIFFNQGIPFYSDTGTGYFETIEIEIMINMLRLIDNIRQDIPLLSIMRSPIGKFTTEELIKIRIKSPKISFIDAMYIYKNNEKNDLQQKIISFIDMIENYKKNSRYEKLNDLIWKILMETDYYYFVGALPNGKVRQANLRLLTDKAFEYENTSMTGLYNFLKYIEKLKLYNSDESTAKILGENDNVVRLMTIHKSKGLEFQVVILCGLNKKFNMMDVSKSILKHKTYGIAPKYVNPELRIYKETLPRIALKDVTKLETLSEEMRVLYVALTRAVDKLILCGTVKSAEGRVKKWRKGTTHYNLYTSQSYLDWICSSIYKHKDGYELRKLCNDDNSIVKNDIHNASFLINILTLKDINYSANQAENKREERIEEIKHFTEEVHSIETDEINRRLSFEYSYKKSINIPTKLSVTDIKNLDKKDVNVENIKYNIPKLVDIPLFKENNINFTQAEIGTITHYVMQHLDLNQQLDIQNINEQIANMIMHKLLTESEAEVVNIEQIVMFFKSDIGKRMLLSSNIKRETPFVIKKHANEVVKNINENEFVLIQGIIDCYFYEKDEIIVIDYKTDKVNDENIDIIKNQYKKQILSYKEAIQKLTNKKVKQCYLYLFDIGKQILIEDED
ncbi:helicase-exonuclease AddAB subunit AddA [Sedimentibacter sp. zth1]|uniref:helicase-exonuclease AddAB subunit AddA n=1 Tax=Sedimentibacter sp. zth1 TaxID=2816908 RepID=UPI001A938687|nr:helicase-exonuclease AddAB subunit AddA [Sedimentibacter sp. zth1]QSX06343.1 helicase-exonuclease AddAB subunit AddA [Sedimentibacter sp. zth1]